MKTKNIFTDKRHTMYPNTKYQQVGMDCDALCQFSPRTLRTFFILNWADSLPNMRTCPG